MFCSRCGYPSFKKGLVLLLFGGLLFAQEQKGGASFPKLDPPKADYGLLTPKENTEDYSFLNKPKTNDKSLMDNEQFIDPGATYLKKLNKEGSISEDTYLGDMYLGDLFTSSKQAHILLRDFGQVDGDLVRILVNDEEIIPYLTLEGQFYQLKLPLKEGFNKVQFQALNQGKIYPNTAELRVYDDLGNPLVVQQWNLSTGAKATLILVKEGSSLQPK